MMKVEELWVSGTEADWAASDARYNTFIKPENQVLEAELEEKLHLVREPDDLQKLGLSNEWYAFFLGKYLRWKYTAANRLASTSKLFRVAYENDRSHLEKLIVSLLQEPDKLDTELMGFKASRIAGLGIAGASGLLALLYPEMYGTIDQFVVGSLLEIRSLPESPAIRKMNPLNLQLRDLVTLTQVYRTKSKELGERFGSSRWTPRRIDRVLWSHRESDG